ncbi:uncharacterized protein LOC121994549 [Zingiber officinale]|uniref:uncharacterized protein LOC121994549 n=1 Tax=Zingiber officinale TaxID=94328 RepID=UPI001C4AF872|nr:uncharacterized protein LOC121994549 [Zingiber officinale]
MFPSAEEIRVVLTLLELADLILERRQPPPPPDSLRWAGRKPRSVASRRRRPLQTSSPPPPLVGKERDASAAAATAASSPTTPLSFQESGGSEEVDARPDPGVERRKRSREVSLPLSFLNSGGEEGLPLIEPGPEHGKRRWKLIAREDRKSFSNTSSSIFSYQSHQATKQREVVSIGGGVADPMAVDHHPWTAAFSAWVQPTGSDGHRQRLSSRAAVGLPDLNVSPTEEEEQLQQEQDRVLGWEQRQQQLMAYRVATSLARRRRVQIQREKRSSPLYNSK